LIADEILAASFHPLSADEREVLYELLTRLADAPEPAVGNASQATAREATA